MNTQTPYQRLCQTHTKCCHNPLRHSLTFIPTLIFFQKNEIFTYSLATQGMWLSENTWSGHPLFSDGKICFLIQSSLLPPGYATPRQIPAVWLQNLTELKNSLITIPLKYPATLTPTNGGNANHVSRRLRGAWKQSRQYRGFGAWAKSEEEDEEEEDEELPAIMTHIHRGVMALKSCFSKIWHILPFDFSQRRHFIKIRLNRVNNMQTNRKPLQTKIKQLWKLCTDRLQS